MTNSRLVFYSISVLPVGSSLFHEDSTLRPFHPSSPYKSQNLKYIIGGVTQRVKWSLTHNSVVQRK